MGFVAVRKSLPVHSCSTITLKQMQTSYVHPEQLSSRTSFWTQPMVKSAVSVLFFLFLDVLGHFNFFNFYAVYLLALKKVSLRSNPRFSVFFSDTGHS